MGTATEDIIMTKTVELRKILQIHDKTVNQIHQLDTYIDSVRERAVVYVLHGNKRQALHLLNKKSVAEGMKNMYSQYCLMKWGQVQELVSNILLTMRPGQTTPAPFQPINDTGYEGEQMEKYIQAMMVSHCNYSRTS